MGKMMDIMGNHVEPRPGAIDSGRKSVFRIARVEILEHPALERPRGARLGGRTSFKGLRLSLIIELVQQKVCRQPLFF